MKKLTSLAVLMIFSNASFGNDIEVLCSKALLVEMKNQELISNSSGICLQSLGDLPQVNIGLGSSVYSSGVATGKSLGNDDIKIKQVAEILTGKPLSQTKFEVLGYADGQNNTLPSYTDQFLGTKSTFKKSDIRSKIKDPYTQAKILELLKDVPETEDLNPVKGGGNKLSFKREDGVKYHANIERVMSLVNNYYLAIDRAVKTCMQLSQGGTQTEDAAKKTCESKVSGFASPNTEVASRGDITCDARRKAVLVLNPGVKASQSVDPGVVHPNFRIPDEGESRRDMQVAASLDLFKKITQATGSDPQSVIEKLATDCSGSPLDSAAYEFNKANLSRMYADIKKLADASTDPALKNAVLKGDYLKVKAIMNDAADDSDGDNPQRDEILKALTYGHDQEASKSRLGFSPTSTNSSSKLSNCQEVKTGNLQYYQLKSYDLPVIRCIQTVNKSGTYVYLAIHKSDHNKVLFLKPNYDNAKFTGHEVSTDYTYSDTAFPKASLDPSSTNVFNCLSSSAAVEEKLNNENQTGAGGEIIDPHDLHPNASGKVVVSMDAKAIPVHKNGDKEEKGWMCDRCHSGLIVNADGTVKKVTRDRIQDEASNHSMSSAPISSLGLTFGSMKNLGFRKVTRDSFGGKCPTSKSVCECLKNSSAYGGLDKILANSTVVNLTKNLKAEMDMTESDLKNSCLYSPPLAHACSVAPSGHASEAVNRGLQSPSCQALDRFLAKYPARNTVIENKYAKKEDYLQTFKNTKLSSMLCKNAFPSEDDAKDCRVGGASGSSGSSSKGSHQ